MIVCKEITFEDDISWDFSIEKSTTATFFQTKEWLSLWLKHFPIKEKILGIFDGSKLVGIVPVSVSNNSVNFLGVTPVLGGELVSDFGDLIASRGREKEVWEAVLSQLTPGRSRFATPSRWPNGLLEGEYRIELNFIREDSASFGILQELGGKVEQVDVAPYIELPATWEDYLTMLDRHDRHELRRKMRKLGNATVSEGNPSDIDEFFRLMRLGSEQKRNFLKPEMRAFFRDIITSFQPKRKLELCFLEHEGRKIAAVLIFIFHNEVLLYNSGFDPEFSHLSPGLVIEAHAIKEAIEKGRKRFDFLRGGERYKYDLGGRKRNLYKISF